MVFARHVQSRLGSCAGGGFFVTVGGRCYGCAGRLMEIAIEVKKYGEQRPHYDGTAYIYINGNLVEKLRTGEGLFVVTTEETYSTRRNKL